jgi:glyoxylase-like metal-dependent hydrolase (beta-lactamase superfamily II)
MIFTQLIDQETSTYTYLLADEQSLDAVIIDSVYENADRDSLLIQEMGLKLKYIIDTHLHADHITGSGELRKRTGAQTAISQLANVPCVDWPLQDGDELKFGHFSLKAIATPGHTNSCMSFYIEGMIFTGDVLLINGCGRTDFQQGDSQKMYESITQKIFTLPIDTKVYPGHDYKGLTYSTIAREKKFNPRVGDGKSLIEFQKIMSELKLTPPKKIDTAVPANKNCGNHLV